MSIANSKSFVCLELWAFLFLIVAAIILNQGNQRNADFGSELNFYSFPSWNGFSSDLNGFTSKFNGLESGTNGFILTGVEKQEDGDDVFNCEFKGAGMENNSKEGNSKVIRDFEMFL